MQQLPTSTTRQAWQQLTHTQPGDALLVRPDGFVAARLSATSTASDLAACVRQVLLLA